MRRKYMLAKDYLKGFSMKAGHRQWPTSRDECGVFIAAIATESTPDQRTLCPIEFFRFR
jgi:hypothetical protein